MRCRRGPGLAVALIALHLACSGDREGNPAAASLAPGSDVFVAGSGGGAGVKNVGPRMVLRTLPALNRASDPPTLSGEAPFDVHLNLCNSDDPDAGDSLNWQFHFGDSPTQPFRLDGTFNPDFEQFCRVDHTYREGIFTATLSVTDKHLEDQTRGVSALARTTMQLRIVSFVKPPPEPSPIPGPPGITLPSPGNPAITSFVATIPGPIVPGLGSDLVWTTTDATACSIDNGVGPVSCNGLVFVAPTQPSTTYTLTATAPGKPPATATATITVASSLSLSAPSPINVGFGSNLSWSMPSPGSATCSIDNGIGPVSCFSGTQFVTPTATTTYTFTALLGGSPFLSASTTVVVIPSVVTFAASPNPISVGFGSNLQWTVSGSGGVTCSIDQGVGPVSCASGSFFVAPAATTTYTFTVTANGTTYTTATATLVVI